MKFVLSAITALVIGLQVLAGPLPTVATVERNAAPVVVDPSASTCFVWIHNGGVGQAGTGTCIASEDGKSLVLTNAHVVEDINGTCTVINAQKDYSGQVLCTARYMNADLALVMVNGELPAAPIADAEPSQGDRIRMWGFGGRMGRDGAVEKIGRFIGRAFNRDNVNSTVQTISGDSGSGWFNDAGELVAVHWGNDGRGWAVPLQAIRTFTKTKGGPLFPRLAKRLGWTETKTLPKAAPPASKPKDIPTPKAKEPTKTKPTTPKTSPTAPPVAVWGGCAGGSCPSSGFGRRGLFRRW